MHHHVIYALSIKFHIVIIAAILNRSRRAPMLDMISDDDDTSVVGDDDRNEECSSYVDVMKGDFVQLLSWCKDDNTVFVRPAGQDKRFERLMTKINQQVGRLRKLTRPTVAEHVIVEYCGDHCRGQITDHGIQLIDIGINITSIKPNSTYASPPFCRQYAKMAVPFYLALPNNMSETEKAAVDHRMVKMMNNIVNITSFTPRIMPYTCVDLMGIGHDLPLTSGCIEKRLYGRDIQTKQVMIEDALVHIVDNKHLPHSFISCVLDDDFIMFGERFVALCEYGETCQNDPLYTADKSEICLVMIPDGNIDIWYRAEHQALLAHDKAQVGLIDFGLSATVDVAYIRKLPIHEFQYECVTFTCKLRSDDCSLSLLDTDQMQNFNRIVSLKIRPAGNGLHEIYLPEQYFLFDEFE